MAKSQPGYHSFTALLSFIPLKKKKSDKKISSNNFHHLTDSSQSARRHFGCLVMKHHGPATIHLLPSDLSAGF